MKNFKRFLCIALSVLLLSVSVGSHYFDANRMDKVEAAEVVVAAGLSAEALYQICLFIGASAATLFAVGEAIDNQDAIAQAGKNFIDSCSTLPDGWLLNMTDMSGQSYVGGTEALQLVQDTEWEVIEGGSPNGDNNDDDDKDKDSWFKWPTVADQTVASFTALGATWLYDTASKIYQKWVNGEELTETESAVLDSYIEGTVDQYDIAEQWSGNPFSADFSSVSMQGTYTYVNSLFISSSMPLAGYYNTVTSSTGVVSTRVTVLCNTNYSISRTDSVYYNDGSLDYSTSNTVTNRNSENFYISDYAGVTVLHQNISCPVFSSAIDAQAYLDGKGDVTKALNYAKTYQVADWLTDDWAGVLIDPLTNIGLSLSQLVALCKALGIHAVDNNLNPDELADLISKSLPAVNPDLLPDTPTDPVVVPDPDIDPIYYPDPDAHPVIDPDPDPGTDSDPGTDPDPGTDNPSSGDDSDGDSGSDDSDSSGTYIVDLSSLFPFCIPYDLIHLVSVLDADPVAPEWQVPFKVPAYGIDYTFDLDLSTFDDVAKIFRLGETLLFILGLILLTRNLIKG